MCSPHMTMKKYRLGASVPPRLADTEETIDPLKIARLLQLDQCIGSIFFLLEYNLLVSDVTHL